MTTPSMSSVRRASSRARYSSAVSRSATVLTVTRVRRDAMARVDRWAGEQDWVVVRHASVWPRAAGELLDVQHALAAAEPAPWRPTAIAPNVGACVVCFARGGT